MAKNIASHDSRKAPIVAALKAKSGCRKVTTVREVSPGVFEATCMWPADASKFQVTAAEAGLQAA